MYMHMNVLALALHSGVWYVSCGGSYNKWVVQFTASIDGRKRPIRYIKDIYIGTVPMCRKEMKSCIAGMYNQPYKEFLDDLSELNRTRASQLSLTQVVAVASAVEAKSSPSAPAAGSLERGVSATGGSYSRHLHSVTSLKFD